MYNVYESDYVNECIRKYANADTDERRHILAIPCHSAKWHYEGLYDIIKDMPVTSVISTLDKFDMDVVEELQLLLCLNDITTGHVVDLIRFMYSTTKQLFTQCTGVSLENIINLYVVPTWKFIEQYVPSIKAYPIVIIMVTHQLLRKTLELSADNDTVINTMARAINYYKAPDELHVTND